MKKSIILTVLTLLVLTGCSPSSNPTKSNPISPATSPTTSPTIVPTTPQVTIPSTAEPTPTSTPDPVQTMLDRMTLDEKIGQMVVGGYNNMDEIRTDIRDHHLGGVILFSRNIPDEAQAKIDIKSLQDTNPSDMPPLLIAADQEGGSVVRLPASMGVFESALTIGNTNDPVYAFNSGVKIAKALNQLGINTDFAPVLDIFSNPANTVIADRAFGTTPDRVAAMSVQVLDGLHSEGIVATGKHFPGHGDTQVDSHFGLPIVYKTVDELNAFEFVPFKNAIENGIDMIMMAHILLDKVDTLPSSLSHKVVTDILRNQLGFKGVVITDDLAMAAITETYGLSDAALRAVNAGCDILLVSQGEPNSGIVIDALKAAVQNGRLTEARINESVTRILTMKQKFK